MNEWTESLRHIDGINYFENKDPDCRTLYFYIIPKPRKPMVKEHTQKKKYRQMPVDLPIFGFILEVMKQIFKIGYGTFNWIIVRNGKICESGFLG